MKTTAVTLFVALCLAQVTRATFNDTTCPAAYEVMQPKIAGKFDVTKLVGEWYEIATHDFTQYPFCPMVSCVRASNKLAMLDDNRLQLQESFSLECGGTGPYTVMNLYNSTEDNGHLVGEHVGVSYPNVMVDFKESKDGGQYDWIIEFQCFQEHIPITGDHIGFTAIQFYTRDQVPADGVLDEMIASAREMGLGYYLDQMQGITKIKQDSCKADTPSIEDLLLNTVRELL